MIVPFRLALPVVFALALWSCDREEIRVYTVAKELPKPDAPSAAAASREEARSELTWTAPREWIEVAPGQVHAASFALKSRAGEATVTITRLPNLAGREAIVVNMWREQVGQPALREEELGGALSEIEVAGEKGKVFEIVGTRDTKPTRIITAMVHRPDASWFFKLAGDESAVAEHKTAFLEFAEGARFKESGEPAEQSQSATSQFGWTVPPGWQAVAPGQMQVAKFAVPPSGEAKAEVTVSVFPNDTGGTLANVNRWRRQIGLGEVDEAGLSPFVTPLDPAPPDAMLVDLQNPPRHLCGAIVPRSGQWFFYKLLGDAEAVAAAREAFIGFVKSSP